MRPLATDWLAQLHQRPPSDYDKELSEAWNAGPTTAGLMEIEGPMAGDPTSVMQEDGVEVASEVAEVGGAVMAEDIGSTVDWDDPERMEY